jgi:hypothetical protein
MVQISKVLLRLLYFSAGVLGVVTKNRNQLAGGESKSLVPLR